MLEAFKYKHSFKLRWCLSNMSVEIISFVLKQVDYEDCVETGGL